MDLRPNHQFDPWSADAERFDGPGINFDDIDFNDPASIFKALGGGGPGGLPIPESQSPDAVRRTAKERRDSIFASYAKLHDILERHEDTIQKRWAKKKKAQRLQILLKAWPNMAPNHRPDFEAFLKESEQQRMSGTKYKDWFMWPYINQEDLSRPRLLPLLLNSRGRHHPCTFAAIDATNTKFAFVTKAVVPIFLNEHTMILNGVDEKHPDDYGKLLSWDEHPSNFELAMSQRQFLPGEGLLVLEVQDRLLSFLIKCCTEILHEIPEDKLLSSSYPVQPEPHMKEESETTGFDSLAVLAAEAPYRVPAKLDFGRIESLLGAQAAASEDHLWSLREDPNYFVDKALELQDHRPETLKDRWGKSYPVNEEVLWSRILSTLVKTAYMDVEVYNELHRQAQELQGLQEKYAKAISVKDDLPKEYLKALLKFRFYLYQATKGVLGELKQTVMSSPPMRYLSIRAQGSLRDLNDVAVAFNPNHKLTPVEKRLVWLLRTLWEDGMDLFLASQPIIVDELERLLETEKEASRMISSYVAGLIGQLSIITQCMRQLDCYQPWARSFESLNIDHEDNIKAAFAETSKPWAAIVRATSEKQGRFHPLVRLGKPASRRFFYPVDKRRTKENVEALRSAEGNLDEFWKGVDRFMYKDANNLENTFVRRLLTQSRSLQRTPEWDESPAPSADDKGAKTTVAIVDDLIVPFSSFFFGLAAPKSEPTPSPKIKVKTRGTTNAPTEPSTLEQTPTPDMTGDKQPTFAVDARSIKVFRTLFYNPNITSSPGEIPWNDFLHAMTSTGFMAEKLYGSVWQFRPTSLDVERAIQFHEPHPKGKLTFMMARRIGRRLSRAYGWMGSMFVSEK
ncbi:hypothetical protein GE21DRAFT_7472 [Neurospora crassa]|uniref:Uncharacterized protein n=2 Tax=Neurospora crassa TaxID=5141 RepID=Q1K8B3_NEUCR|nr:hypothetical protein NCU01053 [Neurospora crassa OR74A]EAA32429.1 hypothetical protein NCU01053 [Neurospora crassa OR74A]KHE88328.1 hypothetical protein GE21DRAFT_7472 [Neurospora crassa]CAD21293.1 hypothetical protein [Neurospora crassa]|eukprot:XP_961665.1 hypothetical protein NCU01053 [Neurospora crassa OR74A]